MDPNRQVWIVLSLGALLCVARLTVVGISDPSEGRYCQISREMADSGDWLVPHWYGVVHLEKPPLAYWTGAAGISLLGRNEAGVRLFPALALLASAWLAAGLARRLGGDGAAPLAAAGVCLAAYPFSVGTALLTDIYDLFAATLFYHSVVRHDRGESARALQVAAAALAIGFLAKGPTIFLFTLAPVALVRFRLLRELVRWRPLALFLVLVLPWIVFVQIRYPEFLGEHAGKLFHFTVTGKQHHKAPVYIYLLVLVLGVFPFSFFVPAGARGRDRRLFLAWLLVPLVFMTAVPSRSWTYILPAAPAVAVLGAIGLLERGLSKRARVALTIGTLVIAAALAWRVWQASPTSRPGRDPGAWVMMACGFLACALWTLITWRRALLPVTAGVALLITVTVISVGSTHESLLKIRRNFARDAIGQAGTDTPVAVVGVNAASIAFYFDFEILMTRAGDRLPHEADLWGKSARFRPDLDLSALLESGYAGLVIAPESQRRSLDPVPEALRVEGPLSLFRVLARGAPR